MKRPTTTRATPQHTSGTQKKFEQFSDQQLRRVKLFATSNKDRREASIELDRRKREQEELANAPEKETVKA